MAKCYFGQIYFKAKKHKRWHFTTQMWTSRKDPRGGKTRTVRFRGGHIVFDEARDFNYCSGKNAPFPKMGGEVMMNTLEGGNKTIIMMIKNRTALNSRRHHEKLTQIPPGWFISHEGVTKWHILIFAVQTRCLSLGNKPAPQLQQSFPSHCNQPQVGCTHIQNP